jgi:hypothetical protein
MARAATTSDPFNAVAEPRRRQILSYLAHQERPVGYIAKRLRLGQPFCLEAPACAEKSRLGECAAERAANPLQDECRSDSSLLRMGQSVQDLSRR